MTDPVQTDRQLRRILAEVLGLAPGQAERFTAATELFGALPELDSMALAGLLVELEDRLDIVIDDGDVDAEAFATFGSLLDFILTRRPRG